MMSVSVIQSSRETAFPAVHERLIAFPELFEAQVRRTPKAPAVFFEGTELDYAELNQRSNQVAWMLLKKGVQSEQRIGICLDRSISAIAAMFGILKAGAAFVPLDPEYPKERLAYIVEDADINWILCEPKYASQYAERTDSGDLQLIDMEDASLASFDTKDPLREIAPDDLAYIMYTSGSTGRPKGVQIEHRALAAYCFADIDIYQLQPSDRTLQFSTLSFDIAIEEIFPPLIMGSSVVVRPRARAESQNEMSTIVERYGVTAIHLATAYWHEWVDLMVASEERAPESIRLMVVTGEKVSAQHYQRWLGLCKQHTLWCNAYGPTEATVSATVFIPPAGWDEDNLPIGKPLKRYTAHILDANQKPVVDGETGELHIGGPALARGYLNRDDLTAKSFVDVALDGTNETRLYKTGDLCRWLPNGDIEFGGRIDHQIKLGSYRIEPGEIEAAINQYPGVLESLVSYDEIEQKKYLIAYVAKGTDNLDLAALSDFLRERLPVYMVPTRFVLLANFPKTINGKIDRTTLPSPATSQLARRHETAEPRTDLERRLVQIWAEVLNVPEVGIHDDFFALGGSSLLVTRVITQVKKSLDVEIPVRDCFANPTVASIARHLTMLNGDQQLDDGAEISRHLRAKLPAIVPLFIRSGDSQCFAINYPPVDGTRKRNHAVLICPSQGHEYVRAHRNLQQLAIQLAQDGFHVLRFDYSGTGNSTPSDKAGVNKWIEDIRNVKAWLESNHSFSNMSVIGVRLGATLATNSQLKELESLLLWDPVLKGEDYVDLIQGFHHTAMTDLWRYPVVRSAEAGQLFGFPIAEHDLAELKSIQIDRTAQARKLNIICSQGYSEAINDFPSDWLRHSTNDEIFWDRAMHTGDAFSSPEAFRLIREILQGDSD